MIQSFCLSKVRRNKMKAFSIAILVCTVLLMMILNERYAQAAEENSFEQARSTSNEFLRRKRGIFHPGVTACEEQKREAREDYEERCEPSIPWQRDRKNNRFCPDINEWKELDAYEIGEGGGFDLDTLGKLIPQNVSMEKIIGGVVAGIITAGVGGKRKSVYANRFLKRSFFHPGSTKCEEQKREAREDYEERCEPSFPLFRNTGTRRFCPDIHDWKAFDNYEIGDGFESRDPISESKINTNRDRNRSRDPNRMETGPDRNGDYDNEMIDQE
ncbi:unnamed protein product [Adineta ricciae]|uniref:Uncharacterized protein n=1 Tax=Adineta ricciae TaxID=249248 RepID=A0A815HRF3_ADIRI|nr:unnamed protein product [Adineta ricciae]